MPQIRSYPQADTIEDTDAFVIDRVGTGTMWVPESVLNTGGGSVAGTPAFMVGLSAPATFDSLDTKWIPFDTLNPIDLDPLGTNPQSAFTYATAITNLGADVAAFVVPTTGIYYLFAQMSMIVTAMTTGNFSASLTINNTDGDNNTLTFLNNDAETEVTINGGPTPIQVVGIMPLTAGTFVYCIAGYNGGTIARGAISADSFMTYFGGFRLQ